MSTVPELFGSMVFDDKVMRARLSADIYHSLKDTIRQGKKLDLSVANRKGRHPFHPLVPAPHRHHRREA